MRFSEATENGGAFIQGMTVKDFRILYAGGSGAVFARSFDSSGSGGVVVKSAARKDGRLPTCSDGTQEKTFPTG